MRTSSLHKLDDNPGTSGTDADADGDADTETCTNTCGDGVVDLLEVCDPGMACADGTSCTQDSDCNGLSTVPPIDDLCLSRNVGSSPASPPPICAVGGPCCNTTCNLTAELDTFYIPGAGSNVITMAVDNTYLWMADVGQRLLYRDLR